MSIFLLQIPNNSVPLLALQQIINGVLCLKSLPDRLSLLELIIIFCLQIFCPKSCLFVVFADTLSLSRLGNKFASCTFDSSSSQACCSLSLAAGLLILVSCHTCWYFVSCACWSSSLASLAFCLSLSRLADIVFPARLADCLSISRLLTLSPNSLLIVCLLPVDNCLLNAPATIANLT